MATEITQVPSQQYVLPTRHGLHELIGVDSGPPRMRRDKDIVRDQVRVSWELEGVAEYNNFMSKYTQFRDIDWIVKLHSPIGGYDRYLCRLVPNTFGLVSNSADMWTVAATLEIRELAGP